jgi:hypothetical protein
VRLVELKRSKPEQFRGLGFVTAEAARIAPMRVVDYLTALADQSPCFGEIDRSGLMGICVSCDGKQCETEDVAAGSADHSNSCWRLIETLVQTLYPINPRQ